MKKYIYIFKSEVMTNLQYIFDILVGFISYAVLIFIFLNLWKYIYSDPNELINGYSLNQMIWYVIVTEILWMSLGGRKLCAKICDDVKSGNIAYNISKPYSYIGYVLSNHMGNFIVKFVLINVIGMGLGYILLGSFPSLNILQILAILLTCILATVISIFLITFLGFISFFIEDASPFYWLYSKFILVLGTIFPIEFFPSVMQPIIKFSPIYVVSYGPAKLFVGFTYSGFVRILVAQITYVFLSYVLCSLIYKKGVRNLNVNGG